MELNYVWWFQFYQSPNKKGMGNMRRYICNLGDKMDFSCQSCLPIGLDSSPQSLNFYLSSPANWSLFGSDIFTTTLPSWISLGSLCKEDLLLYPFFVFLFPVIPCKLRFLKAKIRKCLLVLSKKEGAGSSKELQSSKGL